MGMGSFGNLEYSAVVWEGVQRENQREFTTEVTAE